MSFFDERYAQEVHSPKPKQKPVPPPKKRSRAWLLLLPLALVVLVMVLGCSVEPPEQNASDRLFLDFAHAGVVRTAELTAHATRPGDPAVLPVAETPPGAGHDH